MKGISESGTVGHLEATHLGGPIGPEGGDTDQDPNGADLPVDSGPDDELVALVSELSDDIADRVIAVRRDLHQHPEPSRHEERTTARIWSILESLGLEPQHYSVPTGCYVDLTVPGESVPHIGLRADIDALELDDTKDVPYRSTRDGVAHACGHDAHTAVLLGAAKVLTTLRDQGRLRRGVRLFFQPAEETNPGGAIDVVGDGLLDPLDEVYALHCDPRTQVGQVAVRPGPITSACDRFRVRFSGPGGHSSRPHLSADLVMAIGAVITEVPTLLSRRIDPRVGASLVWGRVRAGHAPNAIPASGELAGTLRCLQLDGWQQARDLIGELVTQVAAPYGVGVEVERSTGIPPTVNDPAGAARVVEVTCEMLGREAVAGTEQSLGGEDFAEMLLKAPGALARLGVRPADAEDWPDLHRPGFDIDEAALGVGVRMMAGLVALP